jgi:hypothetical protein
MLKHVFSATTWALPLTKPPTSSTVPPSYDVNMTFLQKPTSTPRQPHFEYKADTAIPMLSDTIASSDTTKMAFTGSHDVPIAASSVSTGPGTRHVASAVKSVEEI